MSKGVKTLLISEFYFRSHDWSKIKCEKYDEKSEEIFAWYFSFLLGR